MSLSFILSKKALANTALSALAKLSSLVTFAVTAGIITFVFVESIPALREVGALPFLTGLSWHPTQGTFGSLPMVLGSLACALGAVAIAAPVGVGVALFFLYYCPKRWMWLPSGVLEMLNGIPSVVYGFWAVLVLVPILGSTLLTGVVVLALMILPLMTFSAVEAFHHVPKSTLDGAYALGLSRESVIWRILLPQARKGLFVGGLLQVGRALGETMAVMMVCGNVVQLPASWLAPVRTLTANMALEMPYAGTLHRSTLFVSGLFLLLVVWVLHLLSKLLVSRWQGT